VKFSRSLATLGLAVTLALPLEAASAGPELQIPDFSHLRQKAVDSTDITLDGFLMRIARKFAAAEADSEDPDVQALQLLQDIKSVRVRTFTFDTDGAYSKADVDSVRKQLTGPGWNAPVPHVPW